MRAIDFLPPIMYKLTEDTDISYRASGDDNPEKNIRERRELRDDA
jgi:hypothetical protein